MIAFLAVSDRITWHSLVKSIPPQDIKNSYLCKYLHIFPIF